MTEAEGWSLLEQTMAEGGYASVRDVLVFNVRCLLAEQDAVGKAHGLPLPLDHPVVAGFARSWNESAEGRTGRQWRDRSSE